MIDDLSVTEDKNKIASQGEELPTQPKIYLQIKELPSGFFYKGELVFKDENIIKILDYKTGKYKQFPILSVVIDSDSELPEKYSLKLEKKEVGKDSNFGVLN